MGLLEIGGTISLLIFLYCSALYLGLLEKPRKKSRAVREDLSQKSEIEDSPVLEPDIETTELYFDQSIPIVYECLEHLKGDKVARWVHQQRLIYQRAMNLNGNSAFAGLLRNFVEKINSNSDCKVVMAPIQRGSKYFYFKQEHSKTGEQPSLYYTHEIRKEGKLILDFRGLERKYCFIRGIWISDDGEKILYGISSSSEADTMTIFVRDVASGEDSSIDIINDCSVSEFDISWIDGHMGFFYSKKLGHDCCIMFHRLKSPLSSDLVIFSKNRDLEVIDSPPDGSTSKSGRFYCLPKVTFDGQFIMIELYSSLAGANLLPLQDCSLENELGRSSLGHGIYIFELSRFDGKHLSSLGPLIRFVDTFHYRLEYITNQGSHFWFRTNFEASNFRVVEYMISASSSTWDDNYLEILPLVWEDLCDVICERDDGAVLMAASVALKNILVAQYLKNGSHEVLLFDLAKSTFMGPINHAIASLPIPPQGSMDTLYCHYFSKYIFYQYQGLADPGSVFRAILKRNSTDNTVELELDQLCRTTLPHIDLGEFETRQEWCSNINDGTKVPMFVFGRKENLDGGNCSCIMIVNGGFGVSSLPTFSLPLITFCQHFDGILAIVCPRGGGELGRSWHRGGVKQGKENSVTDIISSALHLMESNLVARSRIGLLAGGNGGFLAACVLERRPDIFRAAALGDSIYDLCRYHILDGCQGKRFC